MNTILPIGHTYLDIKKDFVRPMTTSNIATQVPFINVDLQSDSPKALYYGQNHQLEELKEDLGKGEQLQTQRCPTLTEEPADKQPCVGATEAPAPAF